MNVNKAQFNFQIFDSESLALQFTYPLLSYPTHIVMDSHDNLLLLDSTKTLNIFYGQTYEHSQTLNISSGNYDIKSMQYVSR